MQARVLRYLRLYSPRVRADGTMLTTTLSTALSLAFTLQTNGPARLTVATPKDVAQDSQRVVRGARAAQASFESTRRLNLPVTPGGSGGRCDVRVGRLCYWWDEGEWEGPAEPEKIKAARSTLLDRLAAAAARLPGDPWIVGQRVRYLVEAERPVDAVAVARECRATASWCAALEGFALHAVMDFAAADSAFDAAIAAMPEAERCRWTDITLLLDGDARSQYDKLSCANRAPFEERFWALARPLHLLPANDLRIEHFARLTMAELIRTSRYAHDMSWGDDSRELMLRYGWERHWSRDALSVTSGPSIHVIGHEPTPAFSFVPHHDVIEDPASADPAGWALRDPLARSRYAPSYARSMNALDHQVAFFRRGDSALVVAAFDVRRDTTFKRDSIGGALAVAPVTAPDSVLVARSGPASRWQALSITSRWGPMLVSVEARDSAERRIARARTVARPPVTPDSSRVTVSDLLLFDDPSKLPATLDDALPRARGTMRVEQHKPVGVYWEMYGVAPTGETLAYTLTVTRASTPWLRRTAEKLGVVDRQAPVRMKWDEPSGQRDATRARALAVDFSTLPEGRYRIDLSLEAEGQQPVVASRVVDVVERR